MSWIGLSIPLLLCLLVTIAVRGRKVATVNDLLYQFGRPAWLPESSSKILNASPFFIASLIATNLSVVSAFIYLIDGGARFGLWMLWVPASLIFGYFALSAFAPKSGEWVRSNGQACGIVEVLVQNGGTVGRRAAYFIATAWLVLYVLFAFFEMVMCAKLIIMITGGNETLTIVTVLFGTALIYSMIGGIRSVIETDLIQLAFIIAAVVGVLAVGIANWSNRAVPYYGLIEAPSTAAVTLIIGVVMGIATQFYNPYNWHIVRLHESNDAGSKHRCLRAAGVGTAILLVAFVLIGMAFRKEGAWAPGAVMAAVSSRHDLLGALLVAGLACLTISTIDSLMIALVAAVHQIRRVTQESLDQVAEASAEAAQNEIWRMRALLGMLYSFGFSLSIVYLRFVRLQGALEVLLSLAAGAAVLAPFVAACVTAARHRTSVTGPIPLESWYVMTNIVLFAATAIYGSFGKIIGLALSDYAGLVGLILSLVVASVHSARLGTPPAQSIA